MTHRLNAIVLDPGAACLRLALSGLFAALLLAAAALPAGATSIKIVVNNQPITSYDISQRAALIGLTGAGGNATRTAEEELINEALQMQEAERAGLTVNDGDVEEAINGIAQRAGISRSQLNQALGQRGIGLDTLRDRIRAQIAWGRLVSARFRQTSQVTEQDLVAALRESGRDTEKEAVEYELEQVIVVVPASGGSRAKSAARSRANSLRGRFTSCAEGLEFARGLDGVVVKPFGRRLESEVPANVRDTLSDVAVGRLSAPLDRPEGLVMFAVCGKETVRSTSAAMFALEGDIRNERGERFAQQYLRRLRRDALIERR